MIGLFFYSPLPSRYLSAPKVVVEKMSECEHRRERYYFILVSLTRRYLPSFGISFAFIRHWPLAAQVRR